MMIKGSLIHIYYVFLKEIEKIVKEKGKDYLNELEELCYVIKKVMNVIE